MDSNISRSLSLGMGQQKRAHSNWTIWYWQSIHGFNISEIFWNSGPQCFGQNPSASGRDFFLRPAFRFHLFHWEIQFNRWLIDPAKSNDYIGPQRSSWFWPGGESELLTYMSIGCPNHVIFEVPTQYVSKSINLLQRNIEDMDNPWFLSENDNIHLMDVPCLCEQGNL